jgi:superfamily I DNA/RNA helicase
MSPATLAVRAPRAFVASRYQQAFFDWVATGSGNAILKAVAGSGKSTSIVRALAGIPESATVLILAFNSPIAKEMREKIAAFGDELGRTFRNVEASTFHSRGFRALGKLFGRDAKIEVDDGKVRKILKDRLSERELEMYGDFVAKLVGFAKGVGVGIAGLAEDVDATWLGIIATQDMWLDAEEATEERAIDIARKALKVSNAKAKAEKWIDFNDQLYLPLLWNLRLFRHDWVLVDEAQDTNPVRRLFASRCLKFDGRFVAVGDPKQAIYAFTGATSNAMDEIAREFRTIELPLTVSYRCPKAVGRLAQRLVPYFEVAETAIEGEVLDLPAKPKKKDERGAFDGLDGRDMILCRQTAPLISLAFAFIAEGRGCFVLGKDIGAGLSSLIKKLKPVGVPNLVERLDAYLEKEAEKFAKADQLAKLEALYDRVACIKTVIESVGERGTVPAVLAKIDELFADGTGAGLLTLSTMHKSKGREARNVAIYRPELVPSKAAKTEEAYQQECNLLYVAQTRAIETLILVQGEYR